jgi:hypothetical protein
MQPIIMSKDVECTHACTFRDQLWIGWRHYTRMSRDKDPGTQRSSVC